MHEGEEVSLHVYSVPPHCKGKRGIERKRKYEGEDSTNWRIEEAEVGTKLVREDNILGWSGQLLCSFDSF